MFRPDAEHSTIDNESFAALNPRKKLLPQVGLNISAVASNMIYFLAVPAFL
jgi:hypothetical protein